MPSCDGSNCSACACNCTSQSKESLEREIDELRKTLSNLEKELKECKHICEIVTDVTNNKKSK